MAAWNNYHWKHLIIDTINEARVNYGNAEAWRKAWHWGDGPVGGEGRSQNSTDRTVSGIFSECGLEWPADLGFKHTTVFLHHPMLSPIRPIHWHTWLPEILLDVCFFPLSSVWAELLALCHRIPSASISTCRITNNEKIFIVWINVSSSPLSWYCYSSMLCKSHHSLVLQLVLGVYLVLSKERWELWNFADYPQQLLWALIF